MKRFYYSFSVTLLIFLFLAEFFHPITAINVDLGRHLLLGKIIFLTHHVPQTNLLSYTYPNFPYINSSWLFEVIYYYLFYLGGFTLLLAVNTLLIAFAFGLLMYQTIKKNGLSSATLVTITLYLLLLGLRSDIRPEVMSMVCLSLFLLILYRVRESKTTTLLFFLIPLEVLWVNLHIYFFVGPLLILLFLADHLIIHHFRFAKTRGYIITLVGTLISLIINPNGIIGAIFPLTVLHNYGLPIVENQSLLTLFTLYHSSEILLTLIAIVLLFTVLILTRKHTQPIDWLLTIVFSLAAVIIFRNILLFVFTTFLLFSVQVNYLQKKYQPFLKKLPATIRGFSGFLFLLFLFLFIVICIARNGFGFGVRATDEKAVDFLLNNHIEGQVYNNFDIGDYLSSRLYPQRIFVDNRPEAYPTSFFQQVYLPMQNNPEIFTAIAQKYHMTTVVISYWDNTPWGTALMQYFVNKSHFKLVYLDSYVTILLADTAKNHTFIMRHQVTEKQVSLNTEDLEMQIHYLFFFEKVGWKKQVDSTLALIKKKDPQLCSLRQYPLQHSTIEEYLQKNNLNKNCSGKMIML